MLNSIQLKALFASMNALQSAWKAVSVDDNVRYDVFIDMVNTVQTRGINRNDAIDIAGFWEKIETHSFILDDGIVLSGVDLIQHCIRNPDLKNTDSIKEYILKKVVINTIEEYYLSN